MPPRDIGNAYYSALARRTSVPGAVAVFVCMTMVPPVATGQEVDRRVAITFDDVPATALPACGPATVDSLTGRLLDTLAEFDVRAMAFVVESGSCGPDARGTLIRTLERWLDGGHDLGNHTASHPDLNRVSLERYEEDMLLGAQVANSLLRTRGRRLRHFRPPYLHMGPTREKREGLRRLLMKHRYELGPVTMDNQEWVYEAAYRRAVTAGRGALAARIAEAYLEHMEEVFTYYEALSRKELGREIPHILLLHANMINGDHLASVLRILEQRGYRFISVDDALEDPAYDLPDRYVGRMGLSWLQRWLLTRGADVPPEPREVAWVAQVAAGDGLPGIHGFRWRRAERWLEGRLTLLPGSPGPWGLLDLPAREGRTRLPVTRIDTAEGGLAFTIGDPEGSLSVADTAAGGGLLVIREDTFRVADFRALDAHPDPGTVALIGVDPVAPGILSTDRAEEFPSFTPSGDTLYLSRSFREVLQSVRAADGAWGPLTPAPYGSDYRDRAAEVSPDGTALYLTSNRPLPGESREVDNRNHDLWRVPRSPAGDWGEPEPLPGGVNTDSAEYHPSATLDHTVYFSGWSRPGGFGRSDLYRAERTGEEWSPAENLGPAINGPGSESDVFVDPAERYIIFVSTDRPDSRGGDDLYISWRVGDRWSEPRNLGAPVNTFSYEYGPTVSPDGRWLYFTSHRRASADLYRVRLNAILDRSFTPYGR